MITLCLRVLRHVILRPCYGCRMLCPGYVCFMLCSCYGCACSVSVSGGSITFRSTHPQQHEVQRLWNTVFSTSTAAADTTVMSDAHSVGVQVAMLCIIHKKITTSSASRTTRVNTSPPCSYVVCGTMHAVFRPDGRQPCIVAMACDLCIVVPHVGNQGAYALSVDNCDILWSLVVVSGQ